MPTEANDSAAGKERVDEAIASYLEAVDAGVPPDLEEFIAQHREIADELASFFADRAQFERLAEPLQAAACLPGEHPEDVTAALSNESSASQTTGTAIIGKEAPYFGDYELLEEIARGGMGIVYRARQISLNRIVALKMIQTGHLASSEDVQRFHAEAEAAANLDHPGIVPIYEVGEHLGRHYFSMCYVEGNNLALRLREGPLPSREVAELLRQVSEAVQYAHEHGVIHRDLKPANILLEQAVETESDSPDREAATGSGVLAHASRPRITDFGLAKRLNSDSQLTGTGQILGTPSYMSPEQASGAVDHIGPASDVYSLGAILYQLLTGRPPFQAETPLETLSQLLDSDPLPPRLLNRNVPRDLEAICMKCLDKEPARRYSSAHDLADDLGRYLESEPIRASSVNLLDRVTRALRQSRHEEHFRGWGLGLMAFGTVIFLSHLAMFILERTWHDPWVTYFLPRTVMFSALLIMLWRFRQHSVLPTNSAERLVWVVWIGYLLALGAANVVRLVFGHEQSESYASFAVLTGFGFLIMGTHIWGGGYVVGFVFMIAAPLLARYTDLAPLAFGALWAGALLTFGFHYWRLGRSVSASRSGVTTRTP